MVTEYGQERKRSMVMVTGQKYGDSEIEERLAARAVHNYGALERKKKKRVRDSGAGVWKRKYGGVW